MTISLEEVVQQHLGARQQRPQELDADLRRLKADHLKARGDEAIKQGNYRLAWEKYSEAISLKPDNDGLPALHSNRSLAYFKALRYNEALQDADSAVQLAPSWHKAHWRRAAALLALKRVPEAVKAFHKAWRLASGEARWESEARLWASVQRLTREQLGRGILALMAALETEGVLESPKVEVASEQEQAEALFRILKDAHQGQRQPGPFYRRYMDWLQGGMPPAEAYLHRAAAHTKARCYLQARTDAQAAVEALLRGGKQQQQQVQQGKAGEQAAGSAEQAKGLGGTPPLPHSLSERELKLQLARAYRALGEACLAEYDHADRDCRNAAKAFLRAAELDPACSEVHDKLQHTSEDLTGKQIDEIQLEIYHEGSTAPGSGGALSSSMRPPAALGAASRVLPGQRLFQASLRLAFPAAKAANFSSRARELLRGGVAAAAGVDPLAVSIERVLAPTAARMHLTVLMHVTVGAELLKVSDLVKAVSSGMSARDSGASPGSSDSGSNTSMDDDDGEGEEGEERPEKGQLNGEKPTVAEAAAQKQQRLAALLGGEALIALLGLPEPRLCSGEVTDITPACAGASEAEQAQQEAINRGDADMAPEQDRRLALPARPKMELELPYKLYRLVRADGSLVERVDKHPFCMSRVYYDPSEKPEEVWTELMDGSCRWRQTGGEVKVLALRVPSELPSRQLAVDIQPYSLKVWNRASGEVYLEGELERGIVPEDCFWTHCGGEAEDGCALYLRKMNLEVLKKHWMHSEMWWPRLFQEHGEIAWDDYEKDYSDLPEEVLQHHRIAQAIRDDGRHEEEVERKKRELLQEADDVRKRTRQERLSVLRTGKKLPWVKLNRHLPPPVDS